MGVRQTHLKAGEVFYGAALKVKAASPAILRSALLGIGIAALTVEAAEDAPEPSTVFSGTASLWTGAGMDTNPGRDFTSDGGTTATDGVISAIGQVEGQWRGELGRVSARYELGARKFVQFGTPDALRSEDTLVQGAALESALFAGKYFDLGLLGRARDRRGAERDYTDLTAEASIGFVPDPKIDVRVFAGAHRFIYWGQIESSFYTPTFSLSVRYRFDKRHSLNLSGNYEPRAHNALNDYDPRIADPPPRRVRADNVINVGLSYSYRGPFALTVGYSYLDSISNSWGQTFRRHRGSVTAGIKGPWKLTLLANAALQWSQYPDGLFLSSDVTVAEDDENQNAFSVKLVRPLNEALSIDLRYGFYFNRLVVNDLTYLRHLAMVGFAAKW